MRDEVLCLAFNITMPWLLINAWHTKLDADNYTFRQSHCAAKMVHYTAIMVYSATIIPHCAAIMADYNYNGSLYSYNG